MSFTLEEAAARAREFALEQDWILLGEKYLGAPHFVVTPSGAGDPRTWDKRKGYGTSGATSVFGGTDLSEFSLFVYAWERSTVWMPAWNEFAHAVLVKEPKGPAPKALAIVHPMVNAPPLNIDAVNVKDTSQWKQDDEGLWTCEIKVQVFRAPTPALGKPKSKTIPSATQTAQEKADAEMKAKLDEFKSLATQEGFA